jgi:hypothetical protein
MNYIQGEKFKSLANNKTIYYWDTDHVDWYFEMMCPKQPFILISHNSDGAVKKIKTRKDEASLDKAPPNLIKWFAQNVCVEDPRLESIPIGLENSQWFPELKKIQKLETIINLQKNSINLVYANFNISTNVEERSKAYEVCNSLTHVTKHFGKNGEDYDNYLKNLKHHDFIICPPGNGEDTHRLWETLYIGSIPIVKKTINTSYYKNLPICYINDWQQIADQNFLIEQKNMLKSKTNLQMLDFDYWKNKILQTAAAL